MKGSFARRDPSDLLRDGHATGATMRSCVATVQTQNLGHIAISACQNFLMWHSGAVHGRVMRCPSQIAIIWLVSSPDFRSSPKESIMKEWLKPEITESEAGMEVTSYLPAELDRA